MVARNKVFLVFRLPTDFLSFFPLVGVDLVACNFVFYQLTSKDTIFFSNIISRRDFYNQNNENIDIGEVEGVIRSRGLRLSKISTKVLYTSLNKMNILFCVTFSL